ncbi:MAG: HEAT repeat domain-containing protein [Gemmatimonadaceae bacterium]
MEHFTSWTPTMIDAGAKGALLLVAVLIVTRLLRRATAATRHVALAAGIVVLLALPALTALLPRLEVVPVPPPVTEPMTPAPAGAPEEEIEGTRGPRRAVFASGDAALPQARDLAARLVSGSPDPAVGIDDGCALLSRCTVDTLAATSPAEAFVGLWIIVAGALLLRLAAGAYAARRLVRRARPVRDPSWLQLLKDGAEMAGVQGPVRLYESAKVGMPITLGVLRPTIVLPPNATSWSEERRLTVLVHELAHIRRNDVATCLVARVACAIHWMNPLAWRAARKLRDECERACDDLVLRVGMTASTYADDLLDIVRNAGVSRSPAVALPMAQRSDFEGRLLAILEPARRRAPSRIRSLAVAGFVVAIALPLAAMAPTPLADASEHDAAVMNIADHEKHGDEAATGLIGKASAVASAVGSTLDDLGIDVGAIKADVSSAVENAAAAARAYVEDKAYDLVSQYPPAPEVVITSVPEAPQPAQPPPRRQRGQRDQHKQHQPMKIEHVADGDDRAVIGLSSALGDRDPHVRLAAAEGLGILEDPRAVEALSRALRSDENVEVRRMAAWALGEIEDARAVPALAEALRSDADEEVRRMSAWALGEIESPNGVQYLIPFLKDENIEIRSQAAWALGEIESPRAVEALTEALDDSDVKMREMAVWALGEIEDARAIEGLSKALSDGNVGVRRKAAWAIGEIDVSDAPRALIDATRDSDREVRKAAAHALGEIGDPASVPALLALARGQDNAVRYVAVHALMEIEDPSSIEVLVELLKDSDPEVRKLAARALGKH